MPTRRASNTTRDVAARPGCGPAAPGAGCRVVVERVTPEIDAGRFPAKAVVGDRFRVEADVFAEGHDRIDCVLRHRGDAGRWREVPMEALPDDRWMGHFPVAEVGVHRYTIEAWVDHFATWAADLARRLEAAQEVGPDLEIGARLIDEAAARARAGDAARLRKKAADLRAGGTRARRAALSKGLAGLMRRNPDRSQPTRYERELEVWAERERARFSAWYEMFPRSAASDAEGRGGEPRTRHGTFRDVEARLPYVAELGFDILYLPPIHPIGESFRKGPNNSVRPGPDDVGSPWAIGSRAGGHKSIHPDLGSLADLRHLVGAARRLGIEVALDLAFQCSPDHPYVREHPEWFRTRPDGSVQYAENPPKKYQDIYPFDFGTEDREGLWTELLSVVEHWVAQDVRVFRVDNPHTKPFAFWEWLIAEVRSRHPDVILLSEAFTRPRVMYRLAKVGFSQSYTYFAWRTARWELVQYFTELTGTDVRHYFRPCLWPNTPDILTEQLQRGGRPAFLSRLVLAATLGASYGIYGPAYELLENRPLVAGREEYLDSEKYEVREWHLDDRRSLGAVIARVNGIRRSNPALHRDDSLTFHGVDNEQLIAYSKRSPDGDNVVLVIVNLDPQNPQSGWTDLWLERLGLVEDQDYRVHDLLQDAYHRWRGRHNFVELNPHVMPAHVFQIEAR